MWKSPPCFIVDVAVSWKSLSWVWRVPKNEMAFALLMARGIRLGCCNRWLRTRRAQHAKEHFRGTLPSIIRAGRNDSSIHFRCFIASWKAALIGPWYWLKNSWEVAVGQSLSSPLLLLIAAACSNALLPVPLPENRSGPGNRKPGRLRSFLLLINMIVDWDATSLISPHEISCMQITGYDWIDNTHGEYWQCPPVRADSVHM